jgi:hypothetical protein
VKQVAGKVGLAQSDSTRNNDALKALIRDKPDSVLDAVTEWFEKVPLAERDSPIVSNMVRMFTPRQQYDEMKSALRMQLSTQERVGTAERMSDESKSLLMEIIAEYGLE